MAATGLHISISAETIAHIGGLAISNSILTSLIVSAILIALAFVGNSQLKKTGKPTGLQNFLEFIVESLMSLVQSITDDVQKTKRFFPLIATFFLWILLNNWLGLLPGVGSIGFREPAKAEHADLLVAQTYASEQPALAAHDTEAVVTDDHAAAPEVQNPGAADTHSETAPASKSHESTVFVPFFRAGTADLNTTLALAIISVLATQFMGFSYLSFGYFTKFFNFSSPIMFFVGVLELISEVGKILSFAFRLFGNVFAGEVLLVVITFLAKIVVPMPFYGLEIFVGFIQALVFSLLTTVFFNMATQSHEEH